MMKKASWLLQLTVLFGILSSCVPQKNLEYLQSPDLADAVYKLHEKEEHKIKPNDELYVKVSSFDDLSFNYFGNQSEYARSGFSNELSITLMSYTVDDAGDITFPVLGKIQMNGLTLEEATKKMEELLTDYFNQPTVMIKFAYKKITVLGEVRVPGNYTYTKDQINIFEALSLAGDANEHGNRKEVTLVRSQNDSIIKMTLDLSKDDILFSENYMVKPDDILYVKPRRSKKWNIVSTPITLIMSTITSSLLVLDYFNRNNSNN